MYEKDDQKYFIVDGHVHLWDGRASNLKNVHGKWLIEKFVDFQIPEDMLGEYSQITVEQKRKIPGLNAASLYDIDVPYQLRLPAPGQDTVEVAAGARESVSP